MMIRLSEWKITSNLYKRDFARRTTAITMQCNENMTLFVVVSENFSLHFSYQN